MDTFASTTSGNSSNGLVAQTLLPIITGVMRGTAGSGDGSIGSLSTAVSTTAMSTDVETPVHESRNTWDGSSATTASMLALGKLPYIRGLKSLRGFACYRVKLNADVLIEQGTIKTAFGPIFDVSSPFMFKTNEGNHHATPNTGSGGSNGTQQGETNGGTPNSGATNDGTPNNGTTSDGTPNGGTPNGGTPNGGTSHGGTSNSGTCGTPNGAASGQIPNGTGPNGPRTGSGGRSPNSIREEWEEYPLCPPPTPVLPCDRPETFRNAFFEIKSSVLAGFGAFALKNLKWSQTILVEKALFHADRQTLFDELDRLTPSLKQAYYRMHAHPNWLAPNQGKAVSIFTTNSFNTLRGGWGRGSVFLTAARFNHSCKTKNNVVYVYDRNHDVIVLSVNQDVQVGEELTIDYGKDPAGLFLDYGFVCHCGGCTPLTKAQVASLQTPPVHW